MRLFQNSGIYPAYFPRLNALCVDASATTFAQRRSVFLADRFGAPHFLAPVLEGDPSAFFTNADDETLQRQWAHEMGMPAATTMQNILLAQIEAHSTEVFYNLDPIRYGSDFVRRLPGTVRRSIAWRAAPGAGDFSAYHTVVCNFPSILKSFADRGWRAAFLYPAHDPELDAFAANDDRPVDVLFAGGYTRHHSRRAALLQGLASQSSDLKIALHLDASRVTRLVEHPALAWLPLRKHRRPRVIRQIAQPPVMGRALYSSMSRARIVLNGAIDMAGSDRGNMRCFESMGARCVLVSDDGNYPEGMIQRLNMFTYRNVDEALTLIRELIAAPTRLRETADAGHELVRTRYSKQNQWSMFKAIVAA